MSKPNVISIDGVDYVRKDQAAELADNLSGMPYRIIRSRNSGVHAGYVKEVRGDTADLVQARRIYYWEGAATLSQLALEGTKKPDRCKFPSPINLTVFNVEEIIEVTKQAQASILGVKEWKV